MFVAISSDNTIAFAPAAARRAPSCVMAPPPSLEPYLSGDALDADVHRIATATALTATAISVLGLLGLLVVA